MGKQSHLLKSSATDVVPEVRYFRQPLDHFGFGDHNYTVFANLGRASCHPPQAADNLNPLGGGTCNPSFMQKYLISTQHWKRPSQGSPGGPIFLYAGNEAPIELFSNNTGFVWEIAPEYGAMVVFAEHRYYGTTLPFGEDTYKHPELLQWLTAEQALADFTLLIKHIKSSYNCATSPVIVFGGSYGGMLAAWFRIKYPQVVAGAIASSAPIWQFSGIVPDNIFNKLVTRDYRNARSDLDCAAAIRASWDEMERLAATPAGLQQLSATFRTCDMLEDKKAVTEILFGYLSSAWTYMAMADYPYSASFLGAMPPWPVKAACSVFTKETADLPAVYKAASVFYNSSGLAGRCNNITHPGPSNLGDNGWNYQYCTEMWMPFAQDGVDDMFYPLPWNATAQAQWCQEQFGVTPRPDWVISHFGGPELKYESISNIVFSNGNLDPWAGGGVPDSWSDSVVAITIDQGAHHLDLRHSHAGDPQSVIDARNLERQHISKWIAQYLQPAASHACPPDTRSGGSAFLFVLLPLILLIIVFGGCWYRKRSQTAYGQLHDVALTSGRAQDVVPQQGTIAQLR